MTLKVRSINIKFIHYPSAFIQGCGGLEYIAADTGWEAGCTAWKTKRAESDLWQEKKSKGTRKEKDIKMTHVSTVCTGL